MSSFQISDPAETIRLEAKDGVARGTMPFVVTNLTRARVSASVRVIPPADAPAGSFALAGASTVNPTTTSLDFTAEGTQTATVAVALPVRAEAQRGAFRIVVALDGDPENDAAASRPVAFEVPARPGTAPQPARKPFPWLVLVAGLLLALGVLAAALFLMRPGSEPAKPAPDMSDLKTFDDIMDYLDRNADAVFSLDVAFNVDLCLGREDRLVLDPPDNPGPRYNYRLELAQRLGEACPNPPGRVGIAEKLARVRDWENAHRAALVSVPPFTLPEILGDLDLRLPDSRGLAFLTDPDVCLGLDKIVEIKPLGDASKPITAVLFGSGNVPPCPIDQLDEEYRISRKVDEVRARAARLNIPVLFISPPR